MVPLIFATGIAEGGGLFLVATVVLPSLVSKVEVVAIVAAIVTAFRAWTWNNYLSGLRLEGAPTRALAALDQYGRWFFIFGLALPVLLVILGFVVSSIAAALFAGVGVCIVASGAALKFVIVTRAGYNQGFALSHTPVRGSGAAGPAVKPGWLVS
jgi:phenylacetyl-CoA:acceptor oxidoreductase subunit 2